MKNQQGQTLIETMVAIFIMVMGIVSALGLALYSLNASTGITKQIVAVGLAREGLEVVKNMRDTNWLKDPVSTTCYDFVTREKSADCYLGWLNASKGFDFGLTKPGDVKSYALNFDATADLPWNLIEKGSGEDSTTLSATLFSLDYDADALNGFYQPSSSLVAPTSEYFRKVTLEYYSTTFPYDEIDGEYPLIIVTSQVWWNDRRCPVRAKAPNRNDSGDVRCLVTLQTYLTNWKTF
ncbi:MAG: prepilin-type N-terminal cleavage/methylation domain-containing protein [Candidatus Doudnabacteria bacterium]|nr:prepilin-type N-terminal cleavage/methylation domain-containing protein [Candidatus Doudnabacteria bacterium]